MWFEAIFLVTPSKTGISSLKMAQRLRVMQTMAWKIPPKLLQVILERENDKPIDGSNKRVEIDGAYIGGVRHGRKRGRRAAGKTPFVAAVKTTRRASPTVSSSATSKAFAGARRRNAAPAS